MRLSDTAFFFALIIFSVTTIRVQGQPTKKKSTYLWKINSMPPSYLFGTIHIPYTLVWDSVSEDVKTAFNSARQAYFELGDEDPDASCAKLPQGQNISEVSVLIYQMIYRVIEKVMPYCVNSCPVVRGRWKAGFSQPRDHSLAEPCI